MGGEKGKINGSPFGDWSSFCQSWIHTGRGNVAVVSVHPARRCTSNHGVVPVGLGDGVGDCHDAADLSREPLFLSP